MLNTDAAHRLQVDPVCEDKMWYVCQQSHYPQIRQVSEVKEIKIGPHNILSLDASRESPLLALSKVPCLLAHLCAPYRPQVNSILLKSKFHQHVQCLCAIKRPVAANKQPSFQGDRPYWLP